MADTDHKFKGLREAAKLLDKDLRIGWVSRLLSALSYGHFQMGWCTRCHTTWQFVTEHNTEYCYNGNRGLFPLCEMCWSELTPQTRLPYYKWLFQKWRVGAQFYFPIEYSLEHWTAIEDAVRKGG